MVAVDREMITWSRGFMGSSKVFVSLVTLAVASRSFTKDLPRLVTWAYFLSHSLLTLFFFLLHIPVLINHATFSLHWFSNINPCWWVSFHSDGLTRIRTSWEFLSLSGSWFPSQFSLFVEGGAQSFAWQCHNLMPSEGGFLMLQIFTYLSRQPLGQFSW